MCGFTRWGMQAWLGFPAGRPALPLPFGWTNVGTNFPPILLRSSSASGPGCTGWREREAWPMILAAALNQTFMTWSLFLRMREHLWMIFGGVGGEFYLSAAMMCLFFFEFPDRFKWGSCAGTSFSSSARQVSSRAIHFGRK